jgi:hypothetical protein
MNPLGWVGRLGDPHYLYRRAHLWILLEQGRAVPFSFLGLVPSVVAHVMDLCYRRPPEYYQY